jgi:hypothetical protein
MTAAYRPDVDEMLTERKQARICGPDLLRPVELPGIELGTEIALSCANAELEYAKRRDSTRNDLRRRERC